MNYLDGFDHIEKGMLTRSRSNTKFIGVLNCGNNYYYEGVCSKFKSIVEYQDLELDLKFINLDEEKLFNGKYTGIWIDFYFSAKGSVSLKNKKRFKNRGIVDLFDFDLESLKVHFGQVAELMIKEGNTGLSVTTYKKLAISCEYMAPSFMDYLNNYIPIPKIILNQLKNN